MKENVHTMMAGLAELKAEVNVCGMVTITNRNADEMHDLLHMIFDDLGMDTISFNILDPNGGATANELTPTPEQINYCKKVISDHKSSYPISNSTRFLSQSGNFDYRCNPWKSVQIDEKGFLYPRVFSLQRNLTFSRREEKQTCVKINYRRYGGKNKKSIRTMPIVNCVTLDVL